MPINFPMPVIRAAKSVKVDIDLDTLGVRQKKALERALVSGVLCQSSLPHKLARGMRLQAGLPTIVVRSWHLGWNNLPKDHCLFSMASSLIAATLLDGGSCIYYSQQLAKIRATPADGHSTTAGQLNGDTLKSFVAELLKEPLPPYTGPVSGLITLELKDNEAGGMKDYF